MSKKEWRKLNALEHVVEGDWTMAMGSQAAGVSIRQFRRLRRVYESSADKVDAIIHGNTGRHPSNCLSPGLVQQVLELRKHKYTGFNDTHFTEKLREIEDIKLSRQSVQRILRSQKIASPRHHKAKRQRRRRERRARPGWLVQWDGSQHDWLEGRGPRLCLMGAIDDATGKILRGAHFVEHECSASYLRLLRDMVSHHGIPLEIYADRHSCLRRNDDHWSLEEQLAGKQEPPQVQRACENLGIELIWATSPQAKGRIERAWGTFQDRLISELRLSGASTVEEANEVLERYRQKHNQRFSIKPLQQSPAWRKPAKGSDIAEVCAFHTTARVNNDSTIQHQGQRFDLKSATQTSMAGKIAEVRHLLNGRLRVYVDGALVHHSQQSTPTKAPQRRRHRPPSATPQKKSKKPKLAFKEIAAKYKTSTMAHAL